jgi:hypothetical protein
MVADKEHLADYRATTDKSWDMREMLIEDVDGHILPLPLSYLRFYTHGNISQA